MVYDYSINDTSIYPDPAAVAVQRHPDTAVRVGIIRSVDIQTDGSTRYIVEINVNSTQIAVSCVLMQRFGGIHNFEEYKIRPWLNKVPGNLLPPVSAGPYSKRAGDVVVVAFINGNPREGVILGGLNHPGRVTDGESIPEGKIEYLNVFNGMVTEVRDDGSYKLTYNGRAINDSLLDLPPLGVTPPKPLYNPIISGSFLGFDPNGSFLVSDNNVQLIKLEKSVASGNLIIKSGEAKIELSGTLATGDINVKAQAINIEGDLSTSIKSTVSHSVESLQVSIKGTQMAIGSDQFELFQGLSDLIDALGTLTVTSPVGTCTPLSAAPTWAAKVLPLQILIKTMTASLKSAKSASFSGDDSPDSIGDSIES